MTILLVLGLFVNDQERLYTTSMAEWMVIFLVIFRPISLTSASAQAFLKTVQSWKREENNKLLTITERKTRYICGNVLFQKKADGFSA